MTTAANAINSFVEVGTITPGYAAVRAHRPLQGRLASRKALLTSTVLAGAFGLVAAEAIAQQYNLPGSGGFTDVSSSINVVTDAGGGNIRVVLADGVQFFAGPGQYQLNPMTSSLQVATDVLLNAYTGAAPVAAQQTQQAFSAAQAQSYATPTVYPSNAALTLGTNQYATQASVVGGYQMQPATATYTAPSMAYSGQSGQYVPAYSAGMAGYGQVPSYASYSGAGTASSTFGGMQSNPVTNVVPTNQMAMAPAVPAATAAAGGMFGIPTWALVAGGVAAGGAALLAAGSLGSGGSTSGTNSGSSLSISEQAFLNNPEVQAALGNTSAGSQASSGSTGSGSSSGSTSSGTTTTTSGGVTVTGGSTGTSSGSTSTTTSSYTVPAGSSGQTITGSAADDTVIFADGGNVENIASIDLLGGTADRVILKAVDENLDIPDLNNVEYLDIELAADNLEIDLQDIGTEAENVMVDANGSHNFTVLNADAVSKVTVKDGENESAIIKSVADQTTIALENSEDLTVEMKSGSDNELTVSVSAVTDADIVLDGNVDDLTVTSTGSAPNVIANIKATAATVMEINGAQDLEIEEVVGSADLTAVKTIEAAAADGDLTLTLDGTKIEKVTLGDGGDDLTIDDVLDADAEVSTGDGNDDVTINKMVNSGTVDTGSGADDIVLYDALGAGEKIDGGSGTNDEITLNADVTAGTITNVETINIGSVSVDLDKITGETDVNVLSNDTAIIDNLGTDEVDVGSGAKVAVLDATGTALTFDASGSMTLDIDDAAVTTLTVDLGSGATLTFDQDLDTNANATPTLTQLTLTSSGNVVLAEDDHASAFTATGITKIDVSGVSGTFSTQKIGSAGTASGAGTFTGLTEFKGADGIDTISVSSAGGSYYGNTGNDSLSFTGMSGSVKVYGGAGADNVDLGGAGQADDVYFTAAGDLISTTSADVTFAGTYDVVQNFTSGVDELDFSEIAHAGNNSVVEVGNGAGALATAMGVSTTSIIVYDADNTVFSNASVDYVLVNLDGTNWGVVSMGNQTVDSSAGDIEI